MRSLKTAYSIAIDAVEDTNYKISSCLDIGDYWLFTLLLKDDGATFCPPIRISKNDKIEPDFYKGDLFCDCLDGKVKYTSIPLESIN